MERKMVKSFMGTASTDKALAIIPPQEGITELVNVNFFADAIGTYKKYPASVQTSASAACAASTTLVLVCASDGTFNGHTLTTSDYVIIADSSGTGLQLRTVSNAGTHSGTALTLSITLGATATCAAGDKVYIVKAADITSRATTADETRIDAKNQGASYYRMPIAVEVNATGTDTLDGTFEVWAPVV